VSLVQVAFVALMGGSVTLLIVSLVSRSALAAYVAALLAVPICAYLAGAPILFFVPLAFPVLLVYGGKKVASNRQLALLCYLPYMGISALILVLGPLLDAW
jgi:hypothetical protein